MQAPYDNNPLYAEHKNVILNSCNKNRIYTMDKIDLVYLWVDGSDPVWRVVKEEWCEKITGKAGVYKDALSAARWADNDELLYSLRSVEKFVPWAHHIYIITGFGQAPKWLNTKHPKITIVPHEKIMPRDAIPTFNSNAIEKCVANIPNLAEKFLLLNDDVMFGRPITPEYFYDKRGRAIVRHNGHIRRCGFKTNHPTEWAQTIIHSAKVINEIFGRRLYNIYPSHGIDPYLKSSFLEGLNHPHVRDKMQSDIRNKFRTVSELQRWYFNLYDVCTGRAVLRRSRTRKNSKGIKGWWYNLIHWHTIKNSPVYCTNAVRELSDINPPIICINDTPQTSDSVRRSNKLFLAQKFPDKSSFEK